MKQRGSFTHNLAIVFSGNSLSFLIQAILTPITSRIFNAEAYGEFAYYNLIITNIIFFSSLSLPTVYILPKERYKHLALGKVVLINTTILTLISLAIYFIAVNFFGSAYIPAYIILIMVVIILLNTWNSILIAWNQRSKKFMKSTSITVLSNLFSRLGTIGYGALIFPSGFGLLIGNLVSAIFRFVFETRVLPKALMYRFLKNSNLHITKEVFKENIKVTKYIFPSQLMIKVTSQLPILAIGYFYSIELLGYYTFAVSMLEIPKNIFSNSIEPVFYQRANELYHTKKEDLNKFIKSTIYTLISVTLVPLTVISLYATPIFEVVLGNHWTMSGQIVTMIGFQYILSTILSPLTGLRRILGYEKKVLTLNIISMIFRAIALSFLFLDLNFLDFILAYAVINSIYLFMNLGDLVLAALDKQEAIKLIWYSLLIFLLSVSIILFWVY